MAKTSVNQSTSDSDEIVMAHGDNGLEPTPKSEVAMISVLQFAINPKSDGQVCIPITIRQLSRVFGKPKKLTGVRIKGQQWPLLTWRDDKGKRGCCAIRNESDARDVLFDSLPQRSKDRILNSLATLAAQNASIANTTAEEIKGCKL